MQDTLVIIPTFNEKENIERIIRATFSQRKSFDILIVDDSSPDGTAAIVEKLQEEYPKSLQVMNLRIPFVLFYQFLIILKIQMLLLLPPV